MLNAIDGAPVIRAAGLALDVRQKGKNISFRIRCHVPRRASFQEEDKEQASERASKQVRKLF